MAAEPNDQSRSRLPASLSQLGPQARSFLSTESGSAGLLLLATLVALLWANSPASGAYESLWGTDLSITLGDWNLSLDLGHWVDDGLMVLFFFVIGLELRREWSMGELTDRSKVTVPLIAALGGVTIPALIYLAINSSGDAANGWGVVIATDTAFLLGVLALVGPACPAQLRVFLLTLSIVDDVVAVSVIGGAYSDSLDLTAIAVGAVCLVAIAALSRSGAWRISFFALIGAVLWVAAVESGLHPSIAGMLAGLLVSAHPPERETVEQAANLFRRFRQSPLPEVGRTARLGLARAVSVNERMQSLLHPWTSYVIVPLFALANAGVDLRDGVLADALASPITWGVVAGLVVGKLLGVGGFALGALRFGIGSLPQGVGNGQVLGGAALSGIGFTVSLLIADLAFDDQLLTEEAKVGVLMAAGLAALVGWLVFWLAATFRGERTASLPRVLDRPVEVGRDHIRGREGAPLTLVEYSDFECPFCSKATGVVRDLVREFGDDLRYVMRHLPLEDVHPHAELAAEASEAAAAQGKFWEMHDLLFRNSSQLEFEDLVGYAGDLELDVERFVRDIEEGRNSERVREDQVSADASGARGTPTFFVGDRRHVGPYDAESLAAELEASR